MNAGTTPGRYTGVMSESGFGNEEGVSHGGCHCRAVRFRFRRPANLELLDCNCSICRMTGFRHLIIPASDFDLLQGESDLGEYRFNTGQARHRFCRHCGVKSFYHPRSHPDGISVNAHCVDDLPEGTATLKHFDGQNWESAHGQLFESKPETP